MMAVCDVVDHPSLMNHGLFLFFIFFYLTVEVVDDEGIFSPFHQTVTYLKESWMMERCWSSHNYRHFLKNKDSSFLLLLLLL